MSEAVRSVGLTWNIKQKETTSNRDGKGWMQVVCTHFTLHQCLYIRHEEQRQGKQSGSSLFSFHVSPSCHFNKQPLLPHLPDCTFSHKRTEDRLQILLRGTRDRLALGKCQEEGLDVFCLPWESQIHRPSYSPSL